MRNVLAGLLVLAMLGGARAELPQEALYAIYLCDFDEAYNLIRQPADSGDPDAQYLLGRMYDNGDGVPRNGAEAAKWYRRAAELGNSRAQFELGQLHLFGDGVPEDSVEAFVWMAIAAAQDRFPPYQAAIGGSPVDRSDAAAVRDLIAKALTADELALGQRRASEFTSATSPPLREELAAISADLPSSAAAEVRFHLRRLGLDGAAAPVLAPSIAFAADMRGGPVGAELLERLRHSVPPVHSVRQ